MQLLGSFTKLKQPPMQSKVRGLIVIAIVLAAVASMTPINTVARLWAEGVSVAAALLGLLFLRIPDNAVPKPDHASPALAAGIAIAVAVDGIWPWLHGPPGFVHDWKWPLTQQALHDLPGLLGSLWSNWGAGAPAIEAVGSYPVTLTAWFLGSFVSPAYALVLTIAMIAALGGIGIARLARTLSLKPLSQLVAAGAFGATPAWFDRITAGHVAWLLGLALFPWALSLTIERNRLNRWIGALAICWGLAGAQLQFLAIFPPCIAPFLRARDFVFASLSWLAALGMQSPAIAACIFAAQTTAFTNQRPNLYWEQAQSDPLHLAFISGADAAHYFAAWQHGFATVFSIAVIAFAAYGATVHENARRLGILWIAAAIWSSGLDGPFQAPFRWIFLHIPTAIALREFSHAQAIVAPLIVVLTASGCRAFSDRFPRRRLQVAAALCGVLLVCISWPAITQRAAALDPPTHADPQREKMAAAIHDLPGHGQVWWWPGVQPVSEQTRGGVDPEAFTIGSHAPYVEYLPTPALAALLRTARQADRALPVLLAHMGIQAVVLREDVALKSPYFPSVKSLPKRNLFAAGLHLIRDFGSEQLFAVPQYRDGPIIISGRAPIITGDFHDVIAAARRDQRSHRTTLPHPPRGCISTSPLASYVNGDPSRAWVPMLAAPALYNSFDSAFSDVIVTSNRQAHLDAPWVLAAAPGERYQWMSQKTATLLVRHTSIGIWRFARCDSKSTDARHIIPAPVIFAQRYAWPPAWMFLAHGEDSYEAIAVDGYASGAYTDRNARYSDVPAPLQTSTLWALVSLVFAGCLALIIFPR